MISTEPQQMHRSKPDNNSTLWSRIGGLVVGLLCAAIAGCSGADTTGVPTLLTSIPYAALRLNTRAAVMSTVAPYDTLQLVATPYDAAGHFATTTGLVTYTASDTNVQVSPSGLVTAKGMTTTSFVIAQLQDTQLNVTHVDTAYISVTNHTGPSAPLSTFSIQLPSSDSAKVDIPGLFATSKTLPVSATDRLGDTIPRSSMLLHFASSNIGEATVDGKTGTVKGVMAGMVTISATTTYFGVTLTDSVRLLIGEPDAGWISIGSNPNGPGYASFFAGRLIGEGGTIFFTASTTQDYSKGDTMTVIFDDSTAPQASPLSATAIQASTIGGSWKGAMNGTGNIGPYAFPMSALQKATQPNGTTGLYTGGVVSTSAVCTTTPYPCAVMRSFPKAGTYNFHVGNLSSQVFSILVVKNPTFTQ